jgi:hypothetical protein
MGFNRSSQPNRLYGEVRSLQDILPLMALEQLRGEDVWLTSAFSQMLGQKQS